MVVPDGLMFYCRCFLHRENSATLVQFYNLGPKIVEPYPPKKLGANNVQNSVQFQTTSDFNC